jgi:hypothetical protein
LEGGQEISLSEAPLGLRGINSGSPQNRFIEMFCIENRLPFFKKLLRKGYALSSIFSEQGPLPHKKMLPEGVVNWVERLGA